MKRRVHILGASGSGTTTIARMASEQLGYAHFDSDQYYWLPTANPFTVERERQECLSLLENELANHREWILSGSLTGWGDILIPYFDLVAFVYVPTDIRLERLKKREYERHGDAMLVGGTRHAESRDFLAWAAAYDDGNRNGRSLAKHEAWLKSIACTTIRIVNDVLDDSVDALISAIGRD